MEKIVLKDTTELTILSGASLARITIIADNFAALDTIVENLTKKGNLDEIQFKSDNVVTGKYSNMILLDPLFYSVKKKNKQVYATFGVREKTAIECRLDEYNAHLEVTDAALQEVILGMSL